MKRTVAAMVGEERQDEAGHPGGVAEGVRPQPSRPVEQPGAEDDNQPGLLDEVADRLGFRDTLRRHRWLEVAYRAAVAVLGFAIIITGFVLIPLPGPGWLIVFAGLALLATEFAWAERLLHYARDKVRTWTEWAGDQPLWVRGLLGLAGLALIAGLLWLYVVVYGVPAWIPVIGD